MSTQNIKSQLENYKKKYKPNETTQLLVLLIELMDEINVHLENISNKLWE